MQTGQHVAILCQLYLCFGIGRLGTHGKDVENEVGAVENFHTQGALNVAQLFGREFIVENHHTYFAFGVLLSFDVGAYLLEFSLTHIGYRRGAVELLRKALDGDSPCRFGQKLQFVKIFVGLALILVFGYQTYQYGGFGLYFFGFNKSLHNILFHLNEVCKITHFQQITLYAAPITVLFATNCYAGKASDFIFCNEQNHQIS